MAASMLDLDATVLDPVLARTSGVALDTTTTIDAPTLLVTADPGCLMQMRGVASDESPRVVHLATVLEEVTR